tara:strand:+ start:82 stop:315 length:234 start_codon:yes stop_codon:yes gene_type:complete
MDNTKQTDLLSTKKPPINKKSISIQTTYENTIGKEINNYIKSDIYLSNAPKSRVRDESPEIKHTIVDENKELSLLSI